MKLLRIAATLITALAVVSSTVVPKSVAISIRDESALAETAWPVSWRALLPRAIEKRKGGGGGGGRASSSSSGSSGRSSSSSGGGRSAGNTRTSSIGPSFGRSKNHFAGGATVPFSAGSSSPTRKILPFALGAAALGFLPGLWLYGAYIYPYTHSYTFLNRTDTANNPNGANETLPVSCVCAQYSACGCDEDDDLSYLDTFIGNGSYAGLNSSLISVATVNNTKTIFLNGTLPNGTDTGSSAVRSQHRAVEAGGFWVAGAMIVAIVWAL